MSVKISPTDRAESLAKAARLARFGRERIEHGVLGPLRNPDRPTLVSIVQQIGAVQSNLERAGHSLGGLLARELILDRFPTAVVLELTVTLVDDASFFVPRAIYGRDDERMWVYEPDSSGLDARPTWDRELEQAVGALNRADEPRWDGRSGPRLYMDGVASTGRVSGD